jgi:hypothetical protein
MLHFARDSGVDVAGVDPQQFWTPGYVDVALK